MEYGVINDIKICTPNSREELIQHAFEAKRVLIAINAEKILHSNKSFKEIINSNVGYPDGIGAVLGLRKKGFKGVVKVPGCELWLDIIKTYEENKNFYLIGGKQDIIDNVVSKLKKDYPKIEISNYRNGYFKSEQEKKETIDDIVACKPDIIFVAMGSPSQEVLMSEMQKRHKALYQGLGGSFDVYVGTVQRAPNWWVENNLEWLFRLLKQPTRIKRQIHLLRFLFNLILRY